MDIPLELPPYIMKKLNLYITLSISLLLLGIAKAQQPKTVTPTTSVGLEQLVLHYAIQDEEKVRLLNDYARACFYELKFKQGLIATREANLLSEKIDSKGGKIMYYLTLSTFHGSSSLANYYGKQAQFLSKAPDKQLSKYYRP